MKRIKIWANRYADSVSLMAIGKQVREIEGVDEAMVAMATPMNKDILDKIGLSTPDTHAAGSNDMLVAVRAENEEALNRAFDEVEARLSKKSKRVGEKEERALRSLAQVEPAPDTIAVISVPGAYAAHEAETALERGMDVLMFSDNVSLEDEKRLKMAAAERGLLLMGPDCGTAHIGGIGICFSNAVRRGSIGIAAASGTGCQEVMVQIDRLGGGISDAFGTGGRDLRSEIGGITMLSCIDRLGQDSATDVIVCVSKPPAEEVRQRVLSRLRLTGKPSVVCFLGHPVSERTDGSVHFCRTLLEAAQTAVSLALPPSGERRTAPGSEAAPRETHGCPSAASGRPDRPCEPDRPRSVVGLYCGGTLCYEALDVLGDLPDLRSNLRGSGTDMGDRGSVLLDLGDDAFTQGRPHPMIEPSLRNSFIRSASEREDVGVILLDFELGYGSHPDPVGESIGVIELASEHASRAGRSLRFVAYVCGTDKDPGYYRSVEMLKNAGVIIAPSNVEAAAIAKRLVSTPKEALS